MLIGSKYKIETDPNNIILKPVVDKKKKKDEDNDDYENREQGWKIIGYFYDFRELLKFMADYDVKGTGLSDLKAVAKRQAELYSLISSLKKFTPDHFPTKQVMMPLVEA